MKRLLLGMWLAALWLPAFAADRVAITVTLTNAPVVGDFLTVNAVTRTWNTTTSSSTIQTNTTTGLSGTNLFRALGTYPLSGITVSQTASNVVVLTGLPGVAMAATLATNWGTLAYSTNAITAAVVVRVPMSVEPTAGRTNTASQLARDLESYSPTPFGTGTTLLSAYVDKSTSQTVTGSKIFASIITTNLVNKGNAISSVGTGTDSEQFGTGSTATNSGTLAVGKGANAGAIGSLAIGNAAAALTGDLASAIGNAATATGYYSLAVGAGASATREAATALGNSSAASGTNSVAVGNSAEASGTGGIALGTSAETSGDGIALGAAAVGTADNAIAIGPGASVTHADSVSIGASVSSTATNEVRIGNSTQTVRVPGLLVGNVLTNATYHGTIGALAGGTISASTLTNATANTTTLSNTVANGTTDITGLRLPRNTHISLANGANSGVILTNTFTRISAGPSASFSIAGIASGADGRTVILYNSTGQNMTISHESGTEATAANRIITMTGADVATTGNGSCILIYDSSANRWILIASEL